MKYAIIPLILAMIFLVACQPSTPNLAQQPHQSGPEKSQTAAVIEDFAFKPETIRIRQGDTVIWTEQDSAPHTVTSVSGPSSFDSGKLSQHDKFSQTFNAPGTYEYQCGIHPTMRGVIVVE